MFFLALSLMILLISYSVFVALSILFPRVFSVLLQACGIVPGALFNYLLPELSLDVSRGGARWVEVSAGRLYIA